VRIDGELMEIWPNEVCDTCNSFNTIGRRCSEGASNPKSCLALYFFEFVDIFNNRGAFEKPKVKSVYCNR